MDYFTLLNPFFVNGKLNCPEITQETGIKIRTVQRYYAKFRKQVPLPKNLKLGRLRKIPTAINSQIGVLINKNPMLSSNNVSSILNESLKKVESSISSRTVRRRCQEMGYSSKKPVVKPFLSPLHIVKRNKFEANNREKNWDSVIFSDESSFQLRPNVVKYWTKKGGCHF